MSETIGFYSVAQNIEYEVVIEKSKFIANAFYLSQEEAIMQAIALVRNRYPDATHHCYAYIWNAAQKRFQDDGEPSGTAGMPILDVLTKKKLEKTLVIVTRYFGGIKLGAGGLVRAYSKAASEVIRLAGIVFYAKCPQITISLPYHDFAIVKSKLDTFQVKPIDTMYDIGVRYTFVCLPSKQNSVLLFLKENKSICIEKIDEIYFNLEEK